MVRGRGAPARDVVLVSLMERHKPNAIDPAGVRVHTLGDPFFAAKPSGPMPAPAPIGRREQPRPRGWFYGCVYPDGKIRPVRAEELEVIRSAEVEIAEVDEERVKEVRADA